MDDRVEIENVMVATAPQTIVKHNKKKTKLVFCPQYLVNEEKKVRKMENQDEWINIGEDAKPNSVFYHGDRVFYIKDDEASSVMEWNYG